MPRLPLVARRRSVSLFVVATLFLAAASARPALSATPPAPRAFDRTTPRRSLRSFLIAARRGEDEAAARCLTLDQIPDADRATEGASLARELQLVLDHELWLEWERVTDEPEGDPKSPGEVVVGMIPAGGEHLPIVLTRARDPASGAPVWLFSEATVERIPALWAAHGWGWVGDRLPPWLLRQRFYGAGAWQWLGLAIVVAGAYVVGRVLAFALVSGGTWALRRGVRPETRERLAPVALGPVRWVIMAAAIGLGARPLALPEWLQNRVDEAWSCLLLIALAVLAVRSVDAAAGVLQGRFVLGAADEEQRRRVRTQVAVLRRVATVTCVAVGVALVLTRFQTVRNLGVSLLASAGLVGIVCGIAAQRSLGALLAGLQLSFTQPIRIDDTIVIAGEWGRVEEIHLTYVVLELHNGRRLVVPVQKLLEEPFQNWSRNAPGISGSIELVVPPDVDVGAVRAELERQCRSSPLWDQQTCRLQVTDIRPDHVTLEATVSASDAGRSWDLRCELRERLQFFVSSLGAKRRAA